MSQRETIFYTVLDAETLGREKRIDIKYNTVFNEPVEITFPRQVSIDCQQLAELGHLLIELSRNEFDKESVDELIAGYAFPWNLSSSED